jgi:hypothetical protein
MAWIKAVMQCSNITLKNIVNKRICSDHFVSGRKGNYDDTNNQDWVPTINLQMKPNEADDNFFFNESHHADENYDEDVNSYQHFETTANPPSEEMEFSMETINCETSFIRGVVSEIDNSVTNFEHVEKKFDSAMVLECLSIIKAQKEIIDHLRTKLNSFTIDLSYFYNNDQKTLYYTLFWIFYTKCLSHI